MCRLATIQSIRKKAAEIVSSFKNSGGYPLDEFITSVLGKSGHDGAELHNYEGNGVVYVAPKPHQINPAPHGNVTLTPVDHDPFAK